MSQKMDSELKSIVDKYPKLSVKVNKGKRYPIAHSSFKSGSLWVLRRVHCYAVVAVTGQETDRVQDFLDRNFEPCNYPGDTVKYWRVQSIQDMEKTIEFYGNL